MIIPLIAGTSGNAADKPIFSWQAYVIDSNPVYLFLLILAIIIEVVGNEPTITFNLYGETHGGKRYKFDLDKQTAKHF